MARTKAEGRAGTSVAPAPQLPGRDGAVGHQHAPLAGTTWTANSQTANWTPDVQHLISSVPVTPNPLPSLAASSLIPISFVGWMISWCCHMAAGGCEIALTADYSIQIGKRFMLRRVACRYPR